MAGWRTGFTGEREIDVVVDGGSYSLHETPVIQDNVYAHMWWNIAASSGNKFAVKNRDIVAEEMTPAQIADAQKLARECVRKKFKGC